MQKILILASNPRKDLNLDREIRELRAVIEKSRNREDFEVVDELAVRVEDLQELFLKHRPQIVHFCGHGGGEQGLLFDSDTGQEKLLGTHALASLFRLFADSIICVLLNACYSEAQANAIINYTNYVIGIKQEIRDDAAIAFAKGFYRALGYACTIEQAYEFGCNAIQLEISGYARVTSTQSKILRKVEVVDRVTNTPLPEHLKPILKKRALPSPVVPDPMPAVAEDVKDEIHLDIGESLQTGFKVKQYRNVVQGFLEDRKLSVLETLRLEQLQRDLELSKSTAAEVLQEEQEPIKKAQDQYREILNQLIERGCYPFEPEVLGELRDLQQDLGLGDDEIERISAPILAAAAAVMQDRLKQHQPSPAASPPSTPSSAKVQWQRCEFTVITVGNNGLESSRIQSSAKFFAEDLGSGLLLEMLQIPTGGFQMGSPQGEGVADEKPQHYVTVPAFLMGKYAVTQAQWRAVAALPQIDVPLEAEPAKFLGDNRPVEQISWFEAMEFCQRLTRLTGHPYRLPSEAEWEYACRAGTTTTFCFGEILTPSLARYRMNAVNAMISTTTGETAQVGSYRPNGFGLFDMHGNVYEWCADLWHDDYTDAPTDASAWLDSNDKRRIIRGGSWVDLPRFCRSALRDACSPVLRNDLVGLRVVCDALEPPGE
jgi:formylglycine-generating enzyme required for sulfatase activity